MPLCKAERTQSAITANAMAAPTAPRAAAERGAAAAVKMGVLLVVTKEPVPEAPTVVAAGTGTGAGVPVKRPTSAVVPVPTSDTVLKTTSGMVAAEEKTDTVDAPAEQAPLHATVIVVWKMMVVMGPGTVYGVAEAAGVTGQDVMRAGFWGTYCAQMP